MPELRSDRELLEQIERNTRLIAQLLAVTAGRDLMINLRAVLDTAEKEKAYALSDGERSAREVAKQAGTTHSTVGRWWREWREKGLVVERDGGRAESLIDIDMLGPLGHLTDA